MTDPRRPEDFDETLRARLGRIADVLVPAHEGMPAASSVGIAGDLLDKALRARPDLAGAADNVRFLIRGDGVQDPVFYS